MKFFPPFILKTKIKNFVLIDDFDAFLAKKCKECYPDKNDSLKKSILDEKPVFGVNRGSVVPMLKIGNEKFLEPINQGAYIEIFNNFKNKNINLLYRIISQYGKFLF